MGCMSSKNHRPNGPQAMGNVVVDQPTGNGYPQIIHPADRVQLGGFPTDGANIVPPPTPASQPPPPGNHNHHHHHEHHHQRHHREGGDPLGLHRHGRRRHRNNNNQQQQAIQLRLPQGADGADMDDDTYIAHMLQLEEMIASGVLQVEQPGGGTGGNGGGRRHRRGGGGDAAPREGDAADGQQQQPILGPGGGLARGQPVVLVGAGGRRLFLYPRQQQQQEPAPLPGLHPEEVQALPTFIFSAPRKQDGQTGEEDDEPASDNHTVMSEESGIASATECTICYESKIGKEVRLLPCLHSFHIECVDPWLQGHKNCPCCCTEVNLSVVPASVLNPDRDNNNNNSPRNTTTDEIHSSSLPPIDTTTTTTAPPPLSSNRGLPPVVTTETSPEINMSLASPTNTAETPPSHFTHHHYPQHPQPNPHQHFADNLPNPPPTHRDSTETDDDIQSRVHITTLPLPSSPLGDRDVAVDRLSMGSGVILNPPHTFHLDSETVEL
eukprot:TRINITY_DN66737_c9_g1_i1.p1 TRINITY_DN66737_c9_g1~~TRINITY_DN66737_c9_g1_i1.p1  ORF type:complete len:494 (+),score=83.87 TRINITY_DN66737_c9_g1_i1:67-1548(+)